MSEERGSRCLTFQILSSGLGVVTGCIACPLFTFLYGNINAGVWAGLSVIIALMVFHLHLLYRNYRLERWHTGLSLAATRNLGLLTLTAGLAATLYYFYTHIAYHEEMFPIAENSLIAGVWSMMCVKWGFALSWSAHQYKQVLDREYSLI